MLIRFGRFIAVTSCVIATAHAITLTSLGTLGGTHSNSSSINAAGQVVGAATTADGLWHAFLYSNGAMTDLGTLGGSQSSAADINDSGQIVGTSTILGSYNLQAFLYENGSMKNLGSLGSGEADAASINNAGQIVGTSITTNWQRHGYLYSGGVMTDIGDFAPSSINNSGQIAGISPFNGSAQAAIYANGSITGYGALGASYASDLNDLGEFVGDTYMIGPSIT